MRESLSSISVISIFFGALYSPIQYDAGPLIRKIEMVFQARTLI